MYKNKSKRMQANRELWGGDYASADEPHVRWLYFHQFVESREIVKRSRVGGRLVSSGRRLALELGVDRRGRRVRAWVSKNDPGFEPGMSVRGVVTMVDKETQTIRVVLVPRRSKKRTRRPKQGKRRRRAK